MRSVWAILAGFLFIGVLAFGTDAIIRTMSPWAFDASGATRNVPILLVMTLYSAVYGLGGCYIAARLAPSNPMRHAMILGVIGVIVTALVTYSMWEHAPAWFNILGVAMVLPLAWYAGRLRENEIETRGPTAGSSALTA
jgi:surface polysaccharide O-acyltransferase-like enzyme